MMIGYARAEEDHDEDQQRSSLATLGLAPDHIHIDRGLRGTRDAVRDLAVSASDSRA